jgi:hypothetical protein
VQPPDPQLGDELVALRPWREADVPALLRSHLPFKGGRRDTVVFGLLPDELGRRRDVCAR